jgi:hypothetical protein
LALKPHHHHHRPRRNLQITIYSNSQLKQCESRIKSPNSHEWDLPLDFYRGSIN